MVHNGSVKCLLNSFDKKGTSDTSETWILSTTAELLTYCTDYLPLPDDEVDDYQKIDVSIRIKWPAHQPP